MKNEDFFCSQCGSCCELLEYVIEISDELKSFMIEDGSCKHYNKETKLCSIYDTRPLICNVAEYHKKYYPNNSKKDFHEWVHIGCKIAQKKLKKRLDQE